MIPVNLKLTLGVFAIMTSPISEELSLTTALADLKVTPALGSQSAGQESGLAEARELSAASVRLYKAGKYKDALNQAKRALEIYEKTLPAEEKRVIEATGNLAAIQMALKNFKESERLYKRVLLAAQKIGSDPDAANAWDMLAWLHYVMGDARRAETDYKEALALREKTAGPQSKEVAQTLTKLAQLYQFHEDLEKAESLYQRLIAFEANSFPDAKAMLSEARNDYSCVLRKLKKTEQAEELEKQVEGLATTPKVPGITAKEGVLNGKAVRLPRPFFPMEARLRQVSGTVEVRITINEKGIVIHACAQNGHPLLWQVSERAAYGAEFAPTLLEGTPVKITGIITYKFMRR